MTAQSIIRFKRAFPELKTLKEVEIQAWIKGFRQEKKEADRMISRKVGSLNRAYQQ